MRRLLISLVFGCALALRAAGTIAASPGLALAGVPTTLILSANPAPAGPVTWDFGDGQRLTGGSLVVHTYARSGSYLVQATYPVVVGQVFDGASLPLRVAERLGPAAPFTLAMIRLRWEDGRTDASVQQGFTPLVAFADLKYEGTGLLQAQWEVDGIPLTTFTEPLAFAGALTLDSRRAMPLPTTALGEHTVSLRILSPAVAFEVPRIRYFVRLASGEDAPRIDGVSPSAVRPGEEAVLRVTGRRLAPGLGLSFGKDIAVVAPLRFEGPGQAVARVFVAPTAQPGFREVQAFDRTGRTRGPARLEVLPNRPDGGLRPAAGLSPSGPWPAGAGPARATLMRRLALFFLLPGGGASGPDDPASLFPPPGRSVTALEGEAP